MNKYSIESKVRLGDFDPKVGLNRGASKLKEITWFIFKVLFFQSAIPYPSKFKTLLLRLFGAHVGQGLVIKPRVNIHFPWKLSIGDNVWVGEEVLILNFEKLSIGNNVCISQRTFLCGGNHDYRKSSMPYRNGAITLKDGSWVGACTFVGPNVVIGTDSVITAGSVVCEDVEENGIYKGHPAKFIKKRWI